MHGRTRFFSGGALLALALALGCSGGGGGGGGDGSGSTPPLAPTYSISGTVTGAAGVTVALGGAATASTTTDAAGTYTFQGLASGS